MWFTKSPILSKSQSNRIGPESLSKKLIRRILVITAIAILGLGGNIVLSLLLTLQQVENRMNLVAIEAVKAFDLFFLDLQSSLLATSDLLVTSDEIDLALLQLKARNYSILVATIYDFEGNMIAQHFNHDDVQFNDQKPQNWLAQPPSFGEVYMGEVNFEGYVPYIDMAVTIRDQMGLARNLLVVKVDLTQLWHTALDVEVGETGYAYITNNVGQLIAYRNRRLLDANTNLINLVGKTPQQIADNDWIFYRGVNQEPIFAAAEPLSVISWYAVVEQPAKEIVSPLVLGSAILLIILLFISILLLSILYFVQQRLLLPLQNLSVAVQAMQEGQLEQKIPVEHNDELGQLAALINNMSAQVKTLLITLESRVEERTKKLQSQSLELAKAKEAAESANQSKTMFLANMSHELRTPLNAILGFTQLLSREEKIDDEQKQTLNIINSSGEHLLALINDVLEMSKIEAGKINFHQTNFDLHYLLKTIIEMLSIKATTKGLKLIYSWEKNLPRYIQTDKHKLRQIIINLLGNAIKFTEQGSVSLQVNLVQQHQTSAKIGFVVTDTGPGIAPEELANLFTAFVQTEIGRKSHQGTGLGLAISYQFVQLLGGQIDVASQVNRGTTVRFEIPVKTVATTAVETQKHQRIVGLAPNQPQYRIAVVEDKWENRELLERLLRSVGFEVKAVANGLEAVELYYKWKPDLIWMDIQMPVMNGIQATKKIKGGSKHQPPIIIALTASAFDEDKTKILAAGCDDFLSKPFQEAVIFEKISQYLGVKYLYTEENQCQSESFDYNLTASSLEVMPREWIEHLAAAATKLSDKLVLQLIDQIPPQYGQIKTAIASLVDNFRYDLILELTQAQLDKE